MPRIIERSAVILNKEGSAITQMGGANPLKYAVIPEGFYAGVVSKLTTKIYAGKKGGLFWAATPTIELLNPNGTTIVSDFVICQLDADGQPFQPDTSKNLVWGGNGGAQGLLNVFGFLTEDGAGGWNIDIDDSAAPESLWNSPLSVVDRAVVVKVTTGTYVVNGETRTKNVATIFVKPNAKNIEEHEFFVDDLYGYVWKNELAFTHVSKLADAYEVSGELAGYVEPKLPTESKTPSAAPTVGATGKPKVKVEDVW